MTNHTYNSSLGVRDGEIQNMAKLIDLGKLDRSKEHSGDRNFLFHEPFFLSFLFHRRDDACLVQGIEGDWLC